MRPKGQIFDLKRFRDDHNLTQKEIAEAVKRPQSFLSAIEHGKRSAPPGFLDDLSRLYNVDNISYYLRERDKPDFGDVSNVKNAIVNSPGGRLLLNEYGNKLTSTEIQRILDIESLAVSQEKPPQAVGVEASTISELVKLLADSQARCNEAEKRIKELEAQVLDLQAQLPKKAMRAKTRASK